MFKIGFIGVGVMGEAIIKGAVQTGYLRPADVAAYDADLARLEAVSELYSIRACSGIREIAERSEMVLIAVKPAVLPKVLEDLEPVIVNKAILSIVAGWNGEKIKKYLPASARLLCVMPNMPAQCGEGMSVLSSNNTLCQDELQFALGLFGSFGETELIDEKHFDIVTGLSGSGPAFVFMFIEAMTEAGVYNGLPMKTARKLAVQTVLGGARALKESQRHPAEMRDAVCTPAGTTIEGVFDLETHAFNSIVMSAVDKSAKKYRQMLNN